MSKDQTAELLKFLGAFDKGLRETVLWLREFVWDLYPGANELIYDNFNALAIGWSLTERLSHTFCSVAVYRTGGHIHFGFYWGSEIADPKKLLLGKGNQYRYLLVSNRDEFPASYIKKLMKEAYANSLGKIKDSSQITHGATITKSVSAAKRKGAAPGKKK